MMLTTTENYNTLPMIQSKIQNGEIALDFRARQIHFKVVLENRESTVNAMTHLTIKMLGRVFMTVFSDSWIDRRGSVYRPPASFNSA
jgi:hypothetical protein